MPPRRNNKKKKGPEKGFATTSIPKKAPVAPAPDPEPTQDGSPHAEPPSPQRPPESSAQSSSSGQPPHPVAHDLWTTINKIKPTVDRDAQRLLKQVDYEKSISQKNTFISLPHSASFVHGIAAAAREESSGRLVLGADSQEQILTKAAKLALVLSKSRFSRDAVFACLNNIKKFDLDAAIEWLFLNFPDDNFFTGANDTPEIENLQISDPEPQPAPSACSPPEKTPENPSKAAENAQSVSSSTASPARIHLIGSWEADLEKLHPLLVDTFNDADLQFDPDAAENCWAQLKLYETALSRTRRNEFLDSLLSSITYVAKTLQEEYTFSQTHANALKKQLVTHEATQKIAAHLATKYPVESKREVEKKKAQEQEPVNEPSSADSLGANDGLGSLFDEQESAPALDLSQSQILDLSLTRSFSGKTPKVILEDSVRRRDRQSRVSFDYKAWSPSLHTASVSIQWADGSRTSKAFPDKVFCRDKTQALNYVSMLCLFDLGEPIGIHLPGPFRDHWNALHDEKTAREDEDTLVFYKEITDLVNARIDDAKTAKQDVDHESSDNATDTDRKLPGPTRLRPHQLTHDALVSNPQYQAMLQQRASLPMAAFRDTITETLKEQQCMILCGETGCGKSTQLPSFIYEAALASGDDAKILCAEPRRISAISLAERVNQELGLSKRVLGSAQSPVGYNVRFDNRTHSSSRIIYATTGLICRMFEGGGVPQDVTHIIVDEVHERSIDSDFLLLLLKKWLADSPSIRVILMSATVDSDKLSKYMGDAPVVNVPGRTFPVQPYFLDDILPMLPDYTPSSEANPADVDPALISRLIQHVCFENPELQPFARSILVFLPSLASIKWVARTLDEHSWTSSIDVLILHSTVSNDDQSLVFQPPPPGKIKLVLSTNIAETGITIPDVTCVLDTGKHREMRYDDKSQTSKLAETYIAKSNAKQRRGRAGRVQEGIAFHLYSRERFNKLADAPDPEITRLSLQPIILNIKSTPLGQGKEAHAVLSELLDPPPDVNIVRAVNSLEDALALTNTEGITPLGHHLARLPTSVQGGKVLIASCVFGCLDAGVTIAAMLECKSPFESALLSPRDLKRSFASFESDFLNMLSVYSGWRHAYAKRQDGDWARRFQVSLATMHMIEDLRENFLSALMDAEFIPPAHVQRPPATQRRNERRRFWTLSGPLVENNTSPPIVSACVLVAMLPRLLVRDKSAKLVTFTNNAPANISPSSVIKGIEKDSSAEYLMYFNATLTTSIRMTSETALVQDFALWLFAGVSDSVNLLAGSLVVDKKLFLRFTPEHALALRLLRSRFRRIWQLKMRAPGDPLPPSLASWLAKICAYISHTADKSHVWMGDNLEKALLWAYGS